MGNRRRRWSSRFAARVGTFWLLDRNSGGGLLRGSERERRERVRVRVCGAAARRGAGAGAGAGRAGGGGARTFLLPGWGVASASRGDDAVRREVLGDPPRWQRARASDLPHDALTRKRISERLAQNHRYHATEDPCGLSRTPKIMP